MPFRWKSFKICDNDECMSKQLVSILGSFSMYPVFILVFDIPYTISFDKTTNNCIVIDHIIINCQIIHKGIKNFQKVPKTYDA